MALNLNASFPTQTTAPDANYPYGGAQNITVAGDDTGTPWRDNVANDIFGFQQALLTAAAIVPSGSPDNAVVSDYLDAINAIIAAAIPSFPPTQVAVKPTSTSVDNSDTLIDDPDLVLPVEASSRYSFELKLSFLADGSEGIQIGLSVPPGSDTPVSRLSGVHQSTPNLATSLEGVEFNNVLPSSVNYTLATTNGNYFGIFTGVFSTSDAPGNFQFRWAQGTPAGAGNITSLSLNSSLKLTKLA